MYICSCKYLFYITGAHNPERGTPLCSCVFLGQISREFWISNKPYKSVIKNRRLEKSISDVLIALSSSFCYYPTLNAHSYGRCIYFLQNNAHMMKCLLTELGWAGREILCSRSGRTDRSAHSPYVLTLSQICSRLALSLISKSTYYFIRQVLKCFPNY